MAFWQGRSGQDTCVAVGPADEGPQRLLRPGTTIAELLSGSGRQLENCADLETAETVPADWVPLPPIDVQPVWAAGVTFERSRTARNEESGDSDFYDRVYDAARPELFLKAMPGQARGFGMAVAIRADSTWDVPEPELGLVVNSAGDIVGYVLANDVSSRSIEGENPLYLPQAKVYDGSCAVGPCLVPLSEAPPLDHIEMFLTIRRDGGVVYEDSVVLAEMRRTPEELVDWLFMAQSFPRGVILLTGTSIVPTSEFSLATGDTVTIAASKLGVLENRVERVGRVRIASRTTATATDGME